MNYIEISLIPLELCSGHNPDAIRGQQARAQGIGSDPRHRTPIKGSRSNPYTIPKPYPASESRQFKTNGQNCLKSTNNCHNCDSIAANSVATPSIISRSRTLTSKLGGLISDRLDPTGIVSWSQIRTNCEHHVLLPAIKWTVSQPQQLEANSPNCPKIMVNPTIRQETSKESCNSS